MLYQTVVLYQFLLASTILDTASRFNASVTLFLEEKNLPVNSTSIFLLPKKFIFASSNMLKRLYLLGKPSVCVNYFNSFDKANIKSDINILYISLYYIYICIIFIFHILHWAHGGCGRSAKNPYSS